MYYSHSGEKEQGVQVLRLGFEQHSDGLQFLKVAPVYDAWAADPKFKELVAKLGFCSFVAARIGRRRLRGQKIAWLIEGYRWSATRVWLPPRDSNPDNLLQRQVS